MSEYVIKIQGLAQAMTASYALDMEARASAGEDVDAAPALRSKPTVEMVCFDDKSACELPTKPLEETGVQTKLNFAVNGQCDMVGELGDMVAPAPAVDPRGSGGCKGGGKAQRVQAQAQGSRRAPPSSPLGDGSTRYNTHTRMNRNLECSPPRLHPSL